MINLKQYQKTAVESLLKHAKRLLAKDGRRICVFKAPTGSGKTIMIADFLEKLAAEPSLPGRYAFLWVSSHDLHEQSHDKLATYLHDSRYKLSYLEGVSGSELAENEIVFINWESLTKKNSAGEYINAFMRDQESGRTLTNFVANSRAKGIEVILIVDESHHHYWSRQTQEFVQQIVGPKLTIEVSATPQIVPTPVEIATGDAAFVVVTFESVVAEGMIKSSVSINESLGRGVDLSGAADELVLDAAIAKQQELLEKLAEQGNPYRPLVLVQLPSETASMSALDESKKQSVSAYLRDRHGITVENGRLGIWLSNEKKNLGTICDPQGAVDVLIFKQAIALGWDCPRAQILVMFRDIKSATFEVQTVGRILRMPEAKHYDVEVLNRAYVYTNLDRIQVKDDPTDRTYFKTKQAFRIPEYKPIDLPSVYLSRTDYGDLTAAFHDCFYQAANDYFGIGEYDFGNEALAKADSKLELEPDELTTPVMVDVIVENMDSEEARDIIGTTTIELRVAEEDIKLRYEQFAKAMSSPYAPVRSYGKIQQAIYQWFDNWLGYKGSSRLDIQRVVVCSVGNLKQFRQIIIDAKERFAKVDEERKEQKRRRQDEPQWNVPVSDVFSDNCRLITDATSVLQPFFSEPRPSLPEMEFLEELRRSGKHTWWYRNGVNKASYLGIPYTNENGELASAYPDFVVKFKDGRIGIYETKSGGTVTMDETALKSNAIQVYIRLNSTPERPLTGGIVDARDTGLFIFIEDVYSKDSNHSGWVRLRF